VAGERILPAVAVRRALFHVAALALGGALVGGCASSKEVEIVLRATPDMNGARSVYVLARAVDEKAFGSQPYADVAGLVTAPDESVKLAVVVLPGQTKVVKLAPPEKGQLAVQAMLQNPEEDGWRILLPSDLPKSVTVRLERRRICRVEADEKRQTCRVEVR
jgi:predicted component of type VI protein secretion system